MDCKPGRRHILHWPMSARGRKLYPPQKGSLRLVNSAPCTSLTCLHCIFTCSAHPLEKCRWWSWSAPGADPLHHVALSLGCVAQCLIVRCCRMVTRYRYLTYRPPPRRRPSRFVLIRRTGGGEQGPPTESRTRIISSDFSPEVKPPRTLLLSFLPPVPISDKLIKMRPKVEK